MGALSILLRSAPPSRPQPPQPAPVENTPPTEPKAVASVPEPPKKPVPSGPSAAQLQAAWSANYRQQSLAKTAPAKEQTVEVRPTPTAGPLGVSDFHKYLQDQGDTNSCGTASAAMLMNFWKSEPGAYTHQEINKSINCFDGPTSPLNIQDYLRGQGMRAEARNNSTIDDIKGFIDKGVPVQVLFDPTAEDDDLYLHYANVVGYDADTKGNVASLTLADPGGGTFDFVPVEEFKKRWDNLKAKNVPLGLNNVMIVALPKEDTAIQGRDGVTRHTSQIALPAGGNFGATVKALDRVADGANLVGQLSDGAKKLWNSLL